MFEDMTFEVPIENPYDDMIKLLEIITADKILKQTKAAATELLEKKMKIESGKLELELMAICQELDNAAVNSKRGKLKTIINNNKKDS